MTGHCHCDSGPAHPNFCLCSIKAAATLSGSNWTNSRPLKGPWKFSTAISLNDHCSVCSKDHSFNAKIHFTACFMHAPTSGWEFCQRNSMRLMNGFCMERKSSFSCHLQQLLQRAGKCSICSAEKQFLFFFKLVSHSGSHFWYCPQISQTVAQSSEPEGSHATVSAVTVMRKLTWQFSNPVHCGLPFQLSSTVIKHHTVYLKKRCARSSF